MKLIHGGPTFDPIKYVKEVTHVKHMHADSILIHPSFSSKLMITWLNFLENPLLIRFQTDHEFWSTFISSNWIKSKFSYNSWSRDS